MLAGRRPGREHEIVPGTTDQPRRGSSIAGQLSAFRSLAGNRALLRIMAGYALFILTEYSVWVAMLVFAYAPRRGPLDRGRRGPVASRAAGRRVPDPGRGHGGDGRGGPVRRGHRGLCG